MIRDINTQFLRAGASNFDIPPVMDTLNATNFTGDSANVKMDLRCNKLTVGTVVCDTITVKGADYALDNQANTSQSLQVTYDEALQLPAISVPQNSNVVIKNRWYQNLNPLDSNNSLSESGFLALAKQSAPMTSYQNGIKCVSAWNQTQAYANTSGWRDIEWSSELNLFVAVSGARSGGSGATALPVGANNMQYSLDGEIWKNVTWTGGAGMQTSANTNVWFTVKWAPEISTFVAVAKEFTTAGTSHFAYSSDGINWTLGTYRAALDGASVGFENQNTWAGLAWSANKAMWMCVSNNNLFTTSADGITWIDPLAILPFYTTQGDGTPQFDTVVWAPELGKFVAPVYNYTVAGVTDPLLQPRGDKVVYSNNDMMTWTAYDLPVQLQAWWKFVTWSPSLGMLCCVSEQVADTTTGSAIMTSFTGLENSWRGVPYAQTQGNAQRYRTISWAPEFNMFVTVGYNNILNKLLYSFDGVNWTLSGNSTLSAYQVRNIVYSRELCDFVLCASGPAASLGPPVVLLPGYMFISSNIFKLPGPNNVFNGCTNRIDEAGNWGFGAPGSAAMAAAPGKGFLCISAGNLNGNPLPAPVTTLGNGLQTGFAPMFYDTAAKKLYIYNFQSGVWNSSTFT